MNKIAILVLCLTVAFFSGCDQNNSKDNASTDSTDKQIKWKMASTFPGSLVQIGTLGVRFQNQINLEFIKFSVF